MNLYIVYSKKGTLVKPPVSLLSVITYITGTYIFVLLAEVTDIGVSILFHSIVGMVMNQTYHNKKSNQQQVNLCYWME